MKKITPNLGFTLLELMFTLFIVAILATLAAPMMDSTLKTQSVRSLQQDFHSALVYARSEAVTRNRVVSICGSSDGASCSATGWPSGWIIFVDSSATGYGDGVYDAGETLLRVYEYEGNAIPSVVDPDAGTGVTAITYSLRGYTYSSTRAFVQVCPSDSDDLFARGLMLEMSGRVIYSRDADADGIHDSAFEDVVSTNLDCS